MYRVAVEMVRLFARFATPSQKVMLWTPALFSGSNEDTISMGSIASTVLLSTINKPWQPEGLPNIGVYEISRLSAPDLRYVIMLSEGTELFMEGEKALVRNGYHFDDVEDRTIGGAAFKIHLGLIELTDPVRTEALAHARTLSLDTMRRASDEVSIQSNAFRATFRSTSEPYTTSEKCRCSRDASRAADGLRRTFR